jgi:hypothetical protein
VKSTLSAVEEFEDLRDVDFRLCARSSTFFGGSTTATVVLFVLSFDSFRRKSAKGVGSNEAALPEARFEGEPSAVSPGSVSSGFEGRRVATTPTVLVLPFGMPRCPLP